eukprot:g3136.t1
MISLQFGVRSAVRCTCRFPVGATASIPSAAATPAVRYFSSGSPAEDDLESYQGILAQTAKRRMPDEALQVIDVMKKNNELIEMEHYSAAIVACEDRSADALALLSELEQTGLDVDVVVLSAATKACEKAGKYTEAFALNLRLRRLIQKLPEETSRRRYLTKAHKALGEYDMHPLPLTYSLLVAEYVKNEQWKKAFRLVNEMKDKKVKFSFATFDVAASACRAAGRTAEFKQLVGLINEDTMLGLSQVRGENMELEEAVQQIESESKLRYGSPEKEQVDMSYYELLAHADFDEIKRLTLTETGRHIALSDERA